MCFLISLFNYNIKLSIFQISSIAFTQFKWRIEQTLSVEISDSKLNNFHVLKVASNAKQIQLFEKNESLIRDFNIKRLTLERL
jgi:acyl carrier protein